MIDTSKLSPAFLEDIISNMGWENGEDKAPYLARVAAMRPIDALRRFTAWHLGDGEWANLIVRVYEELQAAQAQIAAAREAVPALLAALAERDAEVERLRANNADLRAALSALTADMERLRVSIVANIE
jgi:hypothetical protein